MAMTRRLSGSARWSGLYGAGMLAIFAGERMIGAGTPRAAATGLGLVLVVSAMLVRFVRMQNAAHAASDDRRQVERVLLALYALGLLAVVLYFIQSDVPTLRGGKPLEHGYPRLATALAALWPAVWMAAAWPIALVEMAYATMARAPKLEVGRVRDALLSGLGLAFALIFAFSIAYVTSERDKKVDLAYFRTTSPGESTRKIVRSLDQPIDVALFFAAGTEVREEVVNYFTDLARESSQLKLKTYDFDIDPTKAKEYSVAANGSIVVMRGGRKEPLSIPPQLENARSALRTLDKEVQQRFLTVIKPKRRTLLTAGHDERSYDKSGADPDQRAGVHDLRDVLLDQGHEVRYISASEGLMTDIPKDTSLLMVIGPQKPFEPEEIGVLKRYFEGGGKIFLALDPDSPRADMNGLLSAFGVTFHAATLANDQAFARRTHQDPDHLNLVTANYTNHPSMTGLLRLGMRAPMILPGAGYLEIAKDHAKDVVIDTPLKAHPATFEDKNGNFKHDADENPRAFDLAEAITKGNGRMYVVADSDFMSDAVIRIGGNGLFALDVVRWLLGEEAFAGAITSEADVPVTHTRKQDVGWFYSSVFLMPALVLGLGMTVTRRTRRRKAPRPPGPPKASPNQGAAS